ncbi:hypothetical protein [Galbibacter pacificus]|uniref:Uncharacterized protein n=1 Tax=Galbibacter pacificus TaxID=2996052 RepID=A0ABT6FUG6_9FLAO|nr:hypothetical protein [Galbibacter pacificus]MDG3583620.1 hypothetical protein [Galbibacter pacificus]MDG3586904.1 hypothetical protein [Galbibacter pacificus]
MALNKTEKLGYALLGIILIYSLYLGFTNPDYFNNTYAAEDHTVENGTAFMLLCISLLCLVRLFTISKGKSITWKLGVLLFAIVFFFGAGEEISWGQRIFGIESGEYFLQHNAQKETNLHNLVVGDTKINKIIFSQLLMIGMVVYLLAVPLMYRKMGWVKNLADKFAVPVVKWHQTIAFIAATVAVALIPADRKWEVYELAFGLIFFLIFLYPLNGYLFKKGQFN